MSRFCHENGWNVNIKDTGDNLRDACIPIANQPLPAAVLPLPHPSLVQVSSL